MVVELGPIVTARTIYPGGQSGNPVSPWYADRIAAWSVGELAGANFPGSLGDMTQSGIVSSITLAPRAAR